MSDTKEPQNDGEEFEFDFSQKKKKKAVVVAPAATTGNDDGDDGDDGDEMAFDFGAKKKKSSKKADTATAAPENDDDDGDDEGADDGDDGDDADGDKDNEGEEENGDDNAGASAVPWAGTTRDYTYDELVDRVFSILAADRPDLTSGRKKHQMKPPRVAREGTKKTVWINFPNMCRAMNRANDHVLSYVLAELGTQGSIDGTGRLVIKGRFQPKQIENVVRHYISDYVTCRTCKSPETRLVKENRLYFICCDTCNSRRTVSAIKKGFEAQVGKRRRAREAAAAAAQKPTK